MTIREAVLAGVGIAALPEMMYGAALRAGQLSPVMPGWTFPTPQLYAVFVSRQWMVPAVRAFVDYLVEMLDPGVTAWGYETNFGGLGELAIARASQLLPKPEHLTWEEAACNGVSSSTVYRQLICGAEAYAP